MSKKIYIGEDNLINIKNAMAGKNISHSTFMSEDKPPYEKDEYEIGGEGGNNDFFHVNESYGFSRNVDLSEVGRVNYTWDFDDDYYLEWLEDNGYSDNDDVKLQYIKEGNVEFELDFCDNQTYHTMGSDNVYYDDLEDLFGERMAEAILKNCIEDGSGHFDTEELYYDDNFDINSPSELDDMAMKVLRHGEYYKDCRGFILSNGVVVYTDMEHNEVTRIPGINDKFQFIELGNIRVLDHSIDIGKEPTRQQYDVLKQVLRCYNGEELYLDIFYKGSEIGAQYPSCNPNYVLGEITRFYSEGIKPQGGSFYEGKKIIMPENKLIAIKENIESEVEANEVSLDSFKKQKELAPNIWDGDKLNSRVRLKLLDIADDFWETTDIGWVRPKGIVLMGSICNYNWSKSSDIDLHLQVNFSEVDEKKNFVQEYFNGKKNEWNEEHSNLKIFGFPVELYVEDIDADTNSGGVYDLEENDWIKKPSKDGIKQIGLNKYGIKDKSAKIMTDVDNLYDLFKKTDDDAKLRKIGEKARHILDYVKAMRKDGLSRGGESDKDNIVYKVLRRTGYMDTLWNLSSQLYDKLNSIDEVTEGQAELILEYLEDKHNFPLYQYFKWAKNATDKDKAIDLLRQCGDVAIKYLETRNANQCDELRGLRIRLKRDGEDAQYENDFIEAFGNGIANNGLMCDFEFFMRYRGDFYELPSWMTMDFNRIVKNEWCIHFCYDADSIAREGFKWGTDDMGKLALTGAGMEKPSEGYNFAFPIGEYHIDNNSYGSFNPSTRQRGSQEAVIFQTSGVEVYHEGDEQNQVVFWGPNAKNFIPIKYDKERGGWCIYGNKGQVLYTGKPSKILEWVLTNLPQYRKQIMVGKNGVNLKEEVVADGNASHNPFKQRWKHERETLINYLVNYGELMTSKENGKQYKVLFDEMLSNRIGFNYCLCIQWNPLTMEPGNVIYVRAYDKFTKKIFRPQFDYRGRDNLEGTLDDVV